MGEGLTNRTRHRLIIKCPDCVEDMAAELLAVHQHTQHDMDSGGRKYWETPPRRRSSDVSDVISNRGGTTVVPSR